MRLWKIMLENELFYEWCNGIEYSSRISIFLAEIDDVMVPPLKKRVDIDKYTQKLATNADTIFVVKDLQDIASCSIYCDLQDAFISSIAVKREFLHNGIGTFMLKKVIKHSQKRGCQGISLKVHSNNIRAVHFYKKNGFYFTETSENWNTMELDL